MSEDLRGKIVSTEDPAMIHVLYPGYTFESRFARFRTTPSIFVGGFSSATIRQLRSRPTPFIVSTRSGGDVNLSRQALFQACTRRRRNYKEHLELIPIEEFTNKMRIMRVCDVLVDTQADKGLYEIFRELSRGSARAVALAMDQMDLSPPAYVLRGLMTFYRRVVAYADGYGSAVSQGYNLVIKRAARYRRKYDRALTRMGVCSAFGDRMRVMNLIMEVIF